MTDPNCSVIIRSYNEEKHIGRLLTGIMEQTLKDVEIILVDSGSTDATVSIASRYPVKVVSIKPEDFTFGRSLNIGCEAASGEFLVLASAHVYPVYPDWLDKLIAPFADPGVALTYGQQRGNTTTKFSEHQHFARMYPDSSNFRQETPLCNNANAAIRRSLWEERPYNEELPGLEDLDWATWAVAQGHVLSYVAEAAIVHVHDETPPQVFNRYRREAIALNLIQPEQHFSFFDFVRLFVSNIISDTWHALDQKVFTRVWREILWFRWMQFWGTYQGFRYVGPLTREMKRAFYYPRSINAAGRASNREVEPLDYRRISRQEYEEDPSVTE
ncbi:MAG: glycosyltransferase family 2 protein [Anaerolineales bacterium]|nr:glycosyltransferase family 2 protein [Anaerolineales bacterium]